VLSAQQLPATQARPAATQESQAVIKTGTQEVLLDVIVRDKKGRPLRDLEAKDLEIYDEGVRQKVSGFRLVTGTQEAGLGSTAASTPAGQRVLDPMRQLRLVSLVYDGLDNVARRLAHQASLEFLKNELEQNVYIAVFVIDHRLHVLQPFTNDRTMLRKSIDEATGGHFTQFAAQSESIRKKLEKEIAEQSGNEAAIEGSLPGRGNTGTAGIASASASARFAQMTLNMLRLEQALTRSEQARSSIFSMLSLIREQIVLPGRKTVVYFTEGLQVPENMIEQFQDLIGAANRAGVSIYGVDSRGLTLDAQNASSTTMLASAADSSRRQQDSFSDLVTPDQVKLFDTARGSIHANPQQTLQNLSNNTGGFMIANTNDFLAPFKQITEDVHTYYEVAYVPQIPEYDGKFRKVSVKVARTDVKVQTRSGYFALPPNEGSVFSYEMPLLQALNASPLPRSLPYYAGAVRFRRVPDGVDYSLVVEVPFKDLTFAEEPENQRRSHFSMLALVKNQQGEIVQRFSRDVPLRGPGDKLDVFRKRNYTQIWPLHLAPGRYTVETVVLDREAEKVGARRTALVVPAPAPGRVGISGLSLVRRVDAQQTQAEDTNPYRFEDKRVVPTLDNVVEAAPGGGLSFYFVVYPSDGNGEKPQLTMELSRDGAPVGSAAQELPAANATGVIPYIASFPLSNFPPGQYELRTVVKQGASAAEERAVFTVAKP
jgi:VWFA-related protein